MKKCFIVLDAGSSGLRTSAVSEDGKIIAEERVEYNAKHLMGGLAEYDTADMMAKHKATFDSVLAQVSKDYAVDSIAVSSQRSTIVFWDSETGEPAAPALSWQDGRAAQENNDVLIPQQEVQRITGIYKNQFFSAPKITWTLKNNKQVKELAEKGRLRTGPVASYIIWSLTGGKVFAADYTLAQRMLLLNVRTLEWDNIMLDAYGIDKACLPELKPTTSDYGNYKGIPIKVCVGDQQAAALGIGVEKEGDACINYGTGAFVLLNIGDRLEFFQGLLTSISATPSEDGKCSYLLEGTVNAAGAALHWLSAIGLEFSMADVDRMYEISKNPVLFLPAFGGLGSPSWDSKAQTTLSNLTPATTKEDFIAGALESISFMIADIFAYINHFGFVAQKVKASGGLSNIRSLLQMQANILQLEIDQSPESESTVFGSALLLAKAAGADTSAWQSAEGETFSPLIDIIEAGNYYKKWENFFSWARSFKA
ncbi:glycerol kinase [Parelusimicrobium proximum]|uniref:FGGY family carbohydrate kinase n=1 Tax=Parelusimicrobium proximum TaxID=3228953 RepID=UPI003D179D56